MAIMHNLILLNERKPLRQHGAIYQGEDQRQANGIEVAAQACEAATTPLSIWFCVFGAPPNAASSSCAGFVIAFQNNLRR